MTFIERLFAAATARAVMADLLGGRQVKNGVANCANPSHEDAVASMSVDLDAGVFNCFGCGCSGGVLDLAVLRGLGRDKGEAATALALKWRVEDEPHVNGNGHAAKTSAPEWPWFPKTAVDLGWTLVESKDGRPGLRLPTHMADGSPGQWKRRYKKREDKKFTAEFEPADVKPGLINWPALNEASAGSESPLVVLCAGETDLLAWTWHARHEGIDVPAVSGACGEGTPLGPLVGAFRGVRVVVLYDNDKHGQEGAASVLAELKDVAASVVSIHVPDPHKDVCDYLRSGGTVRELLKLSEKPAEAACVWDVAEQFRLPEPPPAEQFVSRLFVRPSLNIVFGPPSAGKSWAVMALCYDAVVGGFTFLGVNELEIRAKPDDVVLWVFGSEDSPTRVHKRLRVLHRGQDPENFPPGRFHYATPPAGTTLNSPAGWKWLEGLVVEKKATLVVLDTIASLTSDSLDVNKAEQVAPFMMKLLDLRSKHGLVLFALHHTRKGSQDVKRGVGSHADAMLGAQTWRALAEGCLMLDAVDGDTSDVRVRVVKAKDVDDPLASFRVTMEQGTGRFMMLEEEEAAPERTKATKGGRPAKFSVEAVLALRPKNPTGVQWRDVQRMLDISDATWFRGQDDVLTALIAKGCVMIQGALRWQ